VRLGGIQTLRSLDPGPDACFTDLEGNSALPVQVLKGMAPILQPYLQPGSRCLPDAVPLQQASVN
jgi:hypothetical protein